MKSAAADSASSTQNTQTGYRRRRGPRSWVKTARQLLYWLAVAVAVVIAFWNMMPYIKASNVVLTQVFGLTGVWGFIGNRALGIVAIAVGAILWAFIQTAETYPLLLKHDRKLMRIIALEAEQADQLEVREDDDPALVKLKEWYNRFPLITVRSASRIALATYAIDAAICIAMFPPVEGSFGQLMFVLVTGQWGLISWGNVALILVMLFVFERMVALVLFLGMQAYYLRAAHSH